MFTQRRFPWFLAALVGVTLVSSVPGLARAGVILVVSTDPQPGVLACLGVNGQCVLVPLSANPARAFNGGVEAALAQNGSDISFAFTLQDTSGQNQYASTALGTFGVPQPLQITIIGTAGEPVGTPVLLQLNTGTDVDPNTAQEITNQLNSKEYPPITDQIISGFSVGDTFFYWPSVDAPANTPIIFSGVLSVQEAGNPAVPEPGTLALLMTAGLALGVLSLRRTMTKRPTSTQCGSVWFDACVVAAYETTYASAIAVSTRVTNFAVARCFCARRRRCAAAKKEHGKDKNEFHENLQRGLFV